MKVNVNRKVSNDQKFGNVGKLKNIKRKVKISDRQSRK